MAMIYCSECGKKMSDKADKCPNCGCQTKTLMKNINNLYNGQKSLVVYLILCWLLGVVGAHRYYAGKTGSAVVMTILTLTILGMFITGIWALVDFIIGLCNINTPEKIFDK